MAWPALDPRECPVLTSLESRAKATAYLALAFETKLDLRTATQQELYAKNVVDAIGQIATAQLAIAIRARSPSQWAKDLAHACERKSTHTVLPTGRPVPQWGARAP